jgi:acetyl esterase
MTAQTVEDIAYRTIDGVDLLARLYRPDTSGPAPFVIDAHGGAWGSGDRLNNVIIHEEFVRNGIGVFAVDFRLSSAAQFPGPVADVNYAVRWFKANAASLGVNAGPIGGLGSSSGGQQMGLVAFRPNDELYSTADVALEGFDASLAFFVACWPILDPLARYRMAQETGKERLVNAHNAYFPNEDAMVLGNPFLVVERGEATHKPPMVIVQGAADENVNHDRADKFAAAYRAAGGSVELHKYDGQPHTFITANPDDDAAKQAIVTLRDFVLAQSR